MTQPQTILCPRCHQPGRREARFCQHCGHDMVLNNAGPRYYITRIVKAGGQGAVYETVGDDNKTYAVKEMLDDFADAGERDDAIVRFEAEARTLEHLSHPRIPRVYTHFKDEGRHYLAMDFVRGEDLEDIADREAPIAEQQVLAWADQICDVLGYLHTNGLIYRDMKPSNVMIDQQNGGIKLIDFGIAKLLQGTQRGTQIGTPGYAPPEQYQGLATRQSDIYALGATLHHLLTGRDPTSEPPFAFPPARDLNLQVSRRTSDALQRALQMKGEDRFQSLDEFCQALGLKGSASALQPTAPKPAVSAARPPVAATPPVSAARPATPAATAQGTLPSALKPTPPATRAPRRRGRGCVVAVGLVALLLLALSYGLFGGVNFTLPFLSTPTPQTFVQQPFRTTVEIIVPIGSDDAALRSAFEYALLEVARQQYGAGVQLEPGSVIYSGGVPPESLGEDVRGMRYRAAVEGTILVPQT